MVRALGCAGKVERERLGRYKREVSRPLKNKNLFSCFSLKINYLSHMSNELQDLYHIDTLEALAMLNDITARFEELATRTGENAQAFIQECREIKWEK
jgi:hypothetical protein